METTNLDKFLHTVRRIEEHREEKAVNQLKKLYKRLIKDLQSHLGTVYAKYSDENGLLTYARLHKDALDARLLQEVASKMNDVTQAEKKLITELVEQTYSNVYSGMVQAVDKAVDDKDLVTTFAQVQSAKPQALRAAVNNPVHGLTLSAQLEKNRANIIYGIQQAVGIGLSVGDRYDTMAKRVQKALIGDDGAGGSYTKSIRIVRTEAHRVREQGNQDAAKELHNRLEPEGFVMVKTWHTMKDERVRPNVSRKTKKGWKYSIGNGKYNHVKMEGQSVPVNEPFTLPSGVTAMSPGMSGVAGEDINCRCFVSYEVRKINDSKAVRETGGHYYPDGEYDTKYDKQANRAYEKYSREDDSERIAKISGFSVDEIHQVRSHVFFKKHKLENGTYARFAPDYDMAVAWKRLREGKPLERDITLLNHELLESKIEKQYNVSAGEAHKKASETYNWVNKMLDETNGKGEAKGLL
jgi:hypothetical protein